MNSRRRGQGWRGQRHQLHAEEISKRTRRFQRLGNSGSGVFMCLDSQLALFLLSIGCAGPAGPRNFCLTPHQFFRNHGINRPVHSSSLTSTRLFKRIAFTGR